MEWFLGKIGIDQDFAISPWSTATFLKENISKSSQLINRLLYYYVNWVQNKLNMNSIHWYFLTEKRKYKYIQTKIHI